MLQTGFDIPALTGNPFDLSQNDVRVTFKAPNGITGTIPAFFDGGTTWCAIHSDHARNLFRYRGHAQRPGGQPG